MHHYTPKSLKKSLASPPPADAHIALPMRCALFASRSGLACFVACAAGLEPAAFSFQLTLHTGWNPLSRGWRGLHPQRVASAAGAGDVSLVLHGVPIGATYDATFRTFSRPRSPGLQPPKEDSK